MTQATVDIHDHLIEKARVGDRVAQYELYQRYNRAMYSVAYRITGDSQVAEDALQEGFLSAFSALKNFRGDSSFGSWIKRIVVNKSLSLIKKERPYEEMDEETEVMDEGPTDDSLDLNVERVKQAMGQLSSGFRSVLSLYLFEGYDHKEIGEILGISESTSKSQYKRAKDKLRVLLSEDAVHYG